MSPTSTKKEIMLSNKMSKAHVEAMNFVEEHSNRRLEAKMNKLIDRN